VSPRSSEFLAAARDRLAAAVAVVDDSPATALTSAYYAMLYTARAALSEDHISTTTHRGTWHEFRRTFVDTGKVAPELATAAQNTQPKREQADDDAWVVPAGDAREAIDVARALIAAVERLFDA